MVIKHIWYKLRSLLVENNFQTPGWLFIWSPHGVKFQYFRIDKGNVTVTCQFKPFNHTKSSKHNICHNCHKCGHCYSKIITKPQGVTLYMVTPVVKFSLFGIDMGNIAITCQVESFNHTKWSKHFCLKVLWFLFTINCQTTWLTMYIVTAGGQIMFLYKYG